MAITRTDACKIGLIAAGGTALPYIESSFRRPPSNPIRRLNCVRKGSDDMLDTESQYAALFRNEL
mgnify:CR=1 FL=1